MEINDFWDSATFLPNDNPSRLDALISKVYQKREVDFIALCLKLISSHAALSAETGLSEKFDRLKNADRLERFQLLEQPAYCSWFRKTVRELADEGQLRKNLLDLGQVFDSAFNNSKDRPGIVIGGRPLLVKRFDVERQIMEAAFPEYALPDEERRKIFENEVVYPEAFFREMLTIALERISVAWQEAFHYFPSFVKIVVDMIDGEFTSYSSADHTGAIFVSTDNSPLVALEEFLIHEYGHQILYHVMELDPLVTEEDRAIYELPWSENERDLYGYFHAFYIYIFIGRYLEKVKNRSNREQARIDERRVHIFRGLVKAADFLESKDSFTPRGRGLFMNLSLEVKSIGQNL